MCGVQCGHVLLSLWVAVIRRLCKLRCWHLLLCCHGIHVQPVLQLQCRLVFLSRGRSSVPAMRPRSVHRLRRFGISFRLSVKFVLKRRHSLSHHKLNLLFLFKTCLVFHVCLSLLMESVHQQSPHPRSSTSCSSGLDSSCSNLLRPL